MKISCLPERMLFTVSHFVVRPNQPVKIVFTNPDATDHNLVIVQSDKLAEVGMAANEMAKDRANANSDFIPPAKKDLILHASPMIGPTRKSLVHVLRFQAPAKPGVYPFVCTFPGHWIVMNGVMIVAHDAAEAESLLAASKPVVVKQWTMADFASSLKISREETAIVQGMQAFVKARCNQCHVIAGHGINLGPDLTESIKKYKGEQLLRQILEPSHEIHEKFRNYQFEMTSGRLVSGTLLKETSTEYQILTNLLLPQNVTTLSKKDVEEKVALKVSAMPEGLANVLTREEILDLLAFLEAGNQLPPHLQHQHHQHK